MRQCVTYMVRTVVSAAVVTNSGTTSTALVLVLVLPRWGTFRPFLVKARALVVATKNPKSSAPALLLQ